LSPQIALAVAAVGAAAAPESPPASSWPQPVVAKVEAALANMLSLERPNAIGLATIFDGNKYVQCRRDDDRKIRCEAAGALLQPSLARTLTSAHLEELQESFGWALDKSFGNYVQVFPADVSVHRLEQEIEFALENVYEVDPARLEMRTDWVKKEPCPPRNGYAMNLAGAIYDGIAMARLAIHTCAYESPDKESFHFVKGDADELFAAYGARVTGEVERLRVNLDRRVWFILDTEIGLVQCAAEDTPPSLYCEAQSAEAWPALDSVLTPERVARLHAAGFSDPGRAPNYWRNYAIEPFDAAAIARELLTVLHDVYGYRGKPALKIKTERTAD
jgi:hypothetical protein